MTRAPIAEINIVPYVDVMLVLLIIFMITTPLLTQGVDIELPQADAEVLSAEEVAPLIISVDSAGDYFLNVASQPNQPMDAEQLAIRVAAELQLAGQSPPPVLIRGDNSVNYGQIVDVMVLLQQAGATNVGLMTQPPETRDLIHGQL